MTDLIKKELRSEELTHVERKLRDSFCEEYIKDYKAVAACIRIGFHHGFAEDWAKVFMGEPYVLCKIKELERKALIVDVEQEKAILIQSLKKEANYTGPGSSHAARVNALTKLIAILDLEKKTDESDSKVTSVMVVPDIVDVDDWCAVAMQEQHKLTSK